MDNNFIEQLLRSQDLKDEAAAKSIQVDKPVPLTLDLGHLSASDSNILDIKAIKACPEESLKQLVRDNTQVLMNHVFQLETERDEGSLLVKLPSKRTLLPRSQVIPKPKEPTKWEAFAQRKGIVKKTRETKVWDDEAQVWRPRFGFRSKQNQEREWLVEAKGEDDPSQAFAKKGMDRKERVAKNEYSRLKNIAKSAGKRMANNQDSVVPAVEAVAKIRPEKKDFDKAALLAKSSTASLGKFQPQARNEKMVKTGKKQQFESNEANVKQEKDKNLKLFQEVMTTKPKLNVKKAVVNEQMAEQKFNQENPSKKPKFPGKHKAGGRQNRKK